MLDETKRARLEFSFSARIVYARHGVPARQRAEMLKNIFESRLQFEITKYTFALPFRKEVVETGENENLWKEEAHIDNGRDGVSVPDDTSKRSLNRWLIDSGPPE